MKIKRFRLGNIKFNPRSERRNFFGDYFKYRPFMPGKTKIQGTYDVTKKLGELNQRQKAWTNRLKPIQIKPIKPKGVIKPRSVV